MRTPLSFIPLAVFLICEGVFADPFTILKPSTQTYYDESYASLVIRVDDNATDRLDLVMDDNSTISLDVNRSQKDVYCKTIKLKLGDNRITVAAFGGDTKRSDANLSLFFRSEVFAEAVEEPYGYQRDYFHSNANEALCKRCHNMEADKISKVSQDEVLEDPRDSRCFQCHNRIVNRKNGHAPSVNFLCSECHTGKTDEFNMDQTGKSKYLMPDPIIDRCFSCHEDRKEMWFSLKSEHGPTKTGRCNTCHNPHSSDHEFFLRKSIWDLCTTCHAEKASGTHVIRGFVFGKSHPTQGRPDPARPGRELVCSSCHNPHGSESIFLLRGKGKTAFSVCNRCHKK